MIIDQLTKPEQPPLPGDPLDILAQRCARTANKARTIDSFTRKSYWAGYAQACLDLVQLIKEMQG